MREVTKRALRSALVRSNAVKSPLSEQELMRRCLRLLLTRWRGLKQIARRNKRYNHRPGTYVVVAFYWTEDLRMAASAKCHHSGVSLSRLMDFAIATYLDRVLAQTMNACPMSLVKMKFGGNDRYFINYACLTRRNDGRVLEYSQYCEIQPRPPNPDTTA